VSNPSSPNAREAILEAAKRAAQTRGYNGLNFRDLAAEVGIKSASIHYHFPTKPDLGAAVAERYWQDTAAVLASMLEDTPDPSECLHRYPEIFRRSLESDNRMCLCSFMSAEYEDLPEPVRAEVQMFTDVNVAWLSQVLTAVDGVDPKDADTRARAIFAAVAGAQLVARSRCDVRLFDALIDGYRTAGLLAILTPA
jgi:TetR/AcrR family transcriptional repressor of nem operon